MLVNVYIYIYNSYLNTKFRLKATILTFSVKSTTYKITNIFIKIYHISNQLTTLHLKITLNTLITYNIVNLPK